jgi:hypothetical protein
MADSDYKQVPVALAKAIADQFDKKAVVILAWDERHGLLHTTTYGDAAAYKVFAAAMGERLATAAGADLSAKESFEDFRDAYDPAFLREAHEMLREIRGRQGCSPAMLQKIERWLKARGHGLRQG